MEHLVVFLLSGNLQLQRYCIHIGLQSFELQLPLRARLGNLHLNIVPLFQYSAESELKVGLLHHLDALLEELPAVEILQDMQHLK